MQNGTSQQLGGRNPELVTRMQSKLEQIIKQSGTTAVCAADFQVFREQNPLQFIEEQFHKVETDILHPRKGVVSDEYVDFDLWTKGLPSRQEYFADYITTILPSTKYQKLLEVGCGRTPRLAKLLAKSGYEMTAMDPKIVTETEDVEKTEDEEKETDAENLRCIKAAFVFGETDIAAYDAVIAQEPCEATEHVIRACVKAKKTFIISLCGTAHRLMNGEMPEDVLEWYDYLQELLGEKGTIINLNMVPGYLNPIMIGMFGAE